MNSNTSNQRSWLVFLSVILTVTLAVVVIGRPLILRSLQRAALAESLHNLRAVKYALDGFASDFEGRYPSDETRGRVSAAELGNEFSNDYFRQLFLSQITNSEMIFWVKDSIVARTSPPDDEVAREGIPQPDMILAAGDCHWAYIPEQSQTSPGSRPILLDPFIPGTEEFDPDTRERGPIAVLIDGTASPKPLEEIDPLLSPESTYWHGSQDDPRDLLVQPEPWFP